jgi:hypothetical protein
MILRLCVGVERSETHDNIGVIIMLRFSQTSSMAWTYSISGLSRYLKMNSMMD